MGVGLTLPYIAAMMIRARSWIQRGLLAATFGIVMWMVVLTASRGGMVCVLASLCFVWAILVRHSSRGQIIGLLMAAGVLLAIAFAPDVFKDRMRTLWDPTAKEESRIALSADQSSYQRKVLFLRSIQYTLESPLFGLGLGNFAIASGTRTARSSDWMETHNTYTQMSSEAGIPAFLLFAGVTLMTIRRMWRVSKKYAGRSEHAELRLFALATLASMLSFIVGAFFVNMAYSYYLYYVVGISVALQGLAQRAQQEEPAPENDVRRFRNTSKGRFG
jgi:O-antigen ligase